MIFMNGKPTTLENIFDAVHPEQPNLWYTISDEDVGRKIKDILDEWVNNHKTFYYLNGKKVIFELELNK